MNAKIPTVVAFFAVLATALSGAGCKNRYAQEDYIAEGFTQEQLRQLASQTLRTPLPTEATVLAALNEGGRDPTSWFIVSSPSSLNGLLPALRSLGYRPCKLSVEYPPRNIPQKLKPFFDIVSFDETSSSEWSFDSGDRDAKGERDPRGAGIWIIFNQPKKTLLISGYST